MKRRSIVRVLALVLFLIIPVFLMTTYFLQPTSVARGKSSAIPLSSEMTPEQQQAQKLALDDARVQAYTAGHTSEVFGVREVFAGSYPTLRDSCAGADCRQVEIYNFDENAAVTVVVNLDTGEVLDVFFLSGMHPGINKRLADRAMDIALNAPEVIDALGYRPTNGTMAPVPGDLLNSSCSGEHLCAAPSFEVGEEILWAVVDLTEDRLSGIAWTHVGSDEDASAVPFIPEGCPASGTVNRDGWSLNHEVTGHDGLNVYDVTYNGVEVLTSVKMVEWHADYGSSGYRDSTGCSGGGGGFPIYPYGDTEILDVGDGFEVVQDFRMGSWGNSCNYRYEQRIQFYPDGSFKVNSGAYGKGCGDNSMYRPVVRINIAVAGDPDDNFSYYDDNLEGGGWVDLTTETYRVPYAEAGHGPHGTTAENYSWRVTDAAGSGYNIEQDLGQFPQDPASRGSSPFIYFTLHHPEEGDGDLGVIGACCNDDHQQGPDQFVDGENIEDANVVLWYVSQMLTDVTPGDYYCWTITGEPNPETYPCFTGPMFRPFGGAPDFAMTTTPSTQDICVSEDALYSVETSAIGGFSGDIDLSASGNPGSASFVPNPVIAGDTSELTISGASAGNHTFDVNGDSGALSHSNTVSLNVLAGAPGAPALASPPDGAIDVSMTPTYSWNPSADASSYFIEVATDAGFTNVVDSATVEATSYEGGPLSSETTYYWRVTADNVCGGNTSATWSFTTGSGTFACDAGPMAFEAGIPSDWTVQVNSGSVYWSTTDDLAACDNGGNQTLGSGEAACADSDQTNVAGDPYDTELWTNLLDLTGYTEAYLEFAGAYNDIGTEDLFEVWVWDGSVWTMEAQWDADFNEIVSLDLSGYAGLAEVQVSFRYHGAGWDWWAQVDDVALDCVSAEVPDIEVDPTSMSSTQSTNTIVVQMLDISNVGTADLDWFIDEVNNPAPTGGSCDAPSDIPWLSVDPENGTTAPGDTSMVNVEYNSTGMLAGSYTGDLCVFSGDPDEPLVVVPVEMIVEQPTNVSLSSFGDDVSAAGWMLWLLPLIIVLGLGLFVSYKRFQGDEA